MERTFPVSPERVFRAWTEPEAIRRWFGPEGFKMIAAEVDLRVGGQYRWTIQDGDGNVRYVSGTYREIRRPTRLVFTWIWAYEISNPDEEIMLVSVDFIGQGDETRVVLTQERLPDQSILESHRAGWGDSLKRLDRLLREEAE